MGQATLSLISQVRELLDGKLVIPSIQRGYVWKRPQVPKLLDSLYRGFPVGALLIWKTNIDVPLRTAAIVSGESKVHAPALLLDGQQRLTTLAWVIRPSAVATGRVLDTRFDPRTETFLNPSAVQRTDPLLIKVSDILADDAQYGEILKAAGITTDLPAYQEMYDRIHRVAQIRTYQMTVITYESDDYEEVAEIFERVNQGGRRLSKGDIVNSAIAARWEEGLVEIDDFFADLDTRNFRLNRDAVLRLMALLAGLGGDHIRLIRKEMTGDKLKAVWRETERAVRYGVDFLTGDCNIPRASVLTSPNVVAIPGYLLYRRSGTLSAAEATSLRRWVYTAMAFSRYSSQVETKLEAEAKLIDSTVDSEQLFRELLRLASGPRTEGTSLHPSDLERRYASSPFFNLLYIDALRRGVQDWLKNTSLMAAPMTSASAIEYHHIFPKARVREYPPALWNSLANLAFIYGASNRSIAAKAPAEYLPTVATLRLEEQHVPSSVDLWAIDAFEKFLQSRRERLVNVLNEMLGLPLWKPGDGTAPDPSLDADDDDLSDGVEENEE